MTLQVRTVEAEMVKNAVFEKESVAESLESHSTPSDVTSPQPADFNLHKCSGNIRTSLRGSDRVVLGP